MNGLSFTNQDKNDKRPLSISLIGYFYIFGAIVLLLTFNNTLDIGMNVRFGVPSLPEETVKIGVIFGATVMGFGYLKMKDWAYIGMLTYSVLFMLISFNLAIKCHGQPFIGNGIFSLMVIFYTYKNRKLFNN